MSMTEFVLRVGLCFFSTGVVCVGAVGLYVSIWGKM